MDRLSKVTLLPLLLSCVHSYYREPDMFGYKGGNATFRVSVRSKKFHYLLYKGSENASALLKNSSDPSQSYSDSKQSDRVSVSFTSWKSPYFELRNLSVSDSDEYRIEIWGEGTLMQKIFYGLTVCIGKMKVRKEEVNGTIEWTINKVNQSRGDILQIYRDTHTSCSGTERQTILDTEQSFEILPHDMKYTTNLISNGSTIHISNMSGHGGEDCHHILLWKGGQCQLYSEREWNRVHTFLSVGSSIHLLKEGDRFTLAVHPLMTGPVHWYRQKSSEEIQWRLPFNMTPEQEDTDMYVDMSNYSLVIPSASPEHDGIYCYSSESHPQESLPHVIRVCSELNATQLTYSAGIAAALRCDGLWVSEWYRQRDLELEGLIVKKHQPGLEYIHEDLRGRVNVSQSDSLVVSALTPQDSGVYRCRGWKEIPSQKSILCLEQRIHLIYRDPFGVDSMFYRVYVSLVGFGLLVMICVVISVRWRFRGRGQTTQKSLRITV
ncbi:hypothetical protein ACEWY4_000562 [Coilia grayii]|uniref:Immunoglobulin domain-containing protein n=1 Tax=Coilia grayii TaxID=363190 RepID=A0ABD1KX06_9TELE